VDPRENQHDMIEPETAESTCLLDNGPHDGPEDMERI